ncbi:MAG TPA: lipid-binding SYLF domain-containing protein [Terracidiphilus sp.]|jgi:lipid-binding SYLF domain-containing protein
MKSIFAVVTVFAAATVAIPAMAQDRVNNELTEATRIIQEMTGPQNPSGISSDILRNSRCIAVIPKLFKAGIGIGGEHGNGIATCKLEDGRWSAPAPFSTTGGSFGFQIGGEEVGYIMLAMNDEGMQALMSGHFKVGAGVNAAAGPVGRDASASAGWRGAALLSYSRAKGAYAGATLNGAELNQDHEATRQLYGHDAPFNAILNGHVRPPDSSDAAQFIHTVNHVVERAQRGQ